MGDIQIKGCCSIHRGELETSQQTPGTANKNRGSRKVCSHCTNPAHPISSLTEGVWAVGGMSIPTAPTKCSPKQSLNPQVLVSERGGSKGYSVFQFPPTPSLLPLTFTPEICLEVTLSLFLCFFPILLDKHRPLFSVI